jgi:NAD(P)-dependent dehydrogenase (short-subunit alcohol dehydrogenase family)
MADQSLPEMFRLDGQVAVVTGGGGAIGKLAGRTFVEAGARVVLADLDRSVAERAAAEIGAEPAVMDVTDEARVADVLKGVAGRLGRIDVLVNNAGAAKRNPATELALADWSRIIAVNLTGAFLCAREAAKYMLPRKSGSVINVASIMGHVGNALYPNPAYHASKGGLVNLTRALAAEWGPDGVRVNAIAPTFVDTPFSAAVVRDPEMGPKIAAMHPMRRAARADDLAGALLYLASPASALVTGHSLAVDGGWLAV